MGCRIITTIPTYNGEAFLLKVLESVARQTVKPDRVLVLDDSSTDGTEQIVRDFKDVACEWTPSDDRLGLFGNANRALSYAPETDYLHILHQDDVLLPGFYESLIDALEPCQGRGMAFCLDERIDENDQHISVSGKADGSVEEQSVDQSLALKAEIRNQAFSATLLRTARQESPMQFRLDMPILADVVAWADWSRHCEKIVQVNEALCQYRWHGSNATTARAPSIDALIHDEWKTMQIIEGWRQGTSAIRWAKLKGMMAVRSGIKAKRFRQRGNPAYAREIVRAGRKISGPLLWMAGQCVVELRELIVFKIGGRKQHPKNVYG